MLAGASLTPAGYQNLLDREKPDRNLANRKSNQKEEKRDVELSGDSTTNAPPPNQSQDPDSILCPRCASKLPKTSRFCQNCGYKLKE